MRKKFIQDPNSPDQRSITQYLNSHESFKRVTPKWLSHEWARQDILDENTPQELSIKLATRDDLHKITEFFEAVKRESGDPDSFVKSRPNEPIRKLQNFGHILFIENQNEDVSALCFAFTHLTENLPQHSLPSRITEIGTVLSREKGLRLSAITVPALSLLLKNRYGHDHRIIAKVHPDNQKANKLFLQTMRWDTVKCHDTVRSFMNSTAGDTVKQSDDDDQIRHWYEFGNHAKEYAQDTLDTYTKKAH